MCLLQLLVVPASDALDVLPFPYSDIHIKNYLNKVSRIVATKLQEVKQFCFQIQILFHTIIHGLGQKEGNELRSRCIKALP